MKVCIIGISGKLGQYMVEHALARGYEVVGVCRAKSVAKLDRFKGRITVHPGDVSDRAVVARAVEGCDGVLTVLVPWGVDGMSHRTAQAVLDFAEPDARLIFSCGWHVSRSSNDKPNFELKWLVPLLTPVFRFLRIADIDDQVEACRRIFASGRRWTVERGSDLEEGESQGLPIWREHVGDPALASNRTRRVDYALFMVEALTDDTLVRKAPAITGAQTASARVHARRVD